MYFYANSAVEWFTGKDIGDHIYAKIFGEPTAANGAALAAKPVGEKHPVAAVAAPDLTAATAHEPAALPDQPAPRESIEIHQQTGAAVPRAQRQQVMPRHFHHSPYRHSDDFGEPQDSIGKLNINA